MMTMLLHAQIYLYEKLRLPVNEFQDVEFVWPGSRTRLLCDYGNAFLKAATFYPVFLLQIHRPNVHLLNQLCWQGIFLTSMKNVSPCNGQC